MKFRPDTCPRCDITWKSADAKTSMYSQLAAFVWKCHRCGEVVARSDPHSRRTIQ